jgi:Tfp pilus assembly protein PilE|tara:strand:+ start:1256 stop:1612 length:357 start_codon:yes stop_codon:yes gene_type:complete
VAIIGILAAVGIPMYNDYITSSNESSAQNNLRAIALMEEDWFSDNSAWYLVAPADSAAAINTNLFNGRRTLDPDDSNYSYNIITDGTGFQARANARTGVRVISYCLDANNTMLNGADC